VKASFDPVPLFASRALLSLPSRWVSDRISKLSTFTRLWRSSSALPALQKVDIVLRNQWWKVELKSMTTHTISFWTILNSSKLPRTRIVATADLYALWLSTSLWEVLYKGNLLWLGKSYSNSRAAREVLERCYLKRYQFQLWQLSEGMSMWLWYEKKIYEKRKKKLFELGFEYLN
jgi:hypothetical protein